MNKFNLSVLRAKLIWRSAWAEFWCSMDVKKLKWLLSASFSASNLESPLSLREPYIERENSLHGPVKLTYFFCDPENFRIPCMALCSNFSVLSTLPSLLDLNTVKCHAKWPEYPCYRKCIDSLYGTVSCAVRKIYLFPLWHWLLLCFIWTIKFIHIILMWLKFANNFVLLICII